MHFDALRLLGAIAVQTRNPSKAVDGEAEHKKRRMSG
jgi:hypothetical protein